MIISPNGKILAQLDEHEGIAFAELDMTEVDRMREHIPTFNQKRNDVYKLVSG